MPVSILLSALLATSAPQAAERFAPCADAASLPELKGSLCLVQSEPLRAPGPAVGEAPDTVELFVRKFPAVGRARGAVWLVSGGPGESGATFYPFIATLKASFPGFDLVIPDHRGTGFSTRLCPAEEAVDSPGGAALAGAEWGTCWAALNAAPDYARAFSITNAAHDLAELMASHPSRGATYLYGVSYGTQLVVRAMEVAPPSVDGVILDSLIPPETSEQWDLSRRSEIADKIGREVLRRCDAEPPAAPGRAGRPEDGYRRLLDSKDEALLTKIPGKNLKQYFGGLLDDPAARDRIPDLIGELNRGETSTLTELRSEAERVGAMLGHYPQAPSSIPLVSIISVSENDARPDLTAAEVAAAQSPLWFASPLPGYLVAPGLPLYPRDSHFGSLPDKLPPTLVLQGTLDPKTPMEGARAQVEQMKKAGMVTLVPVADSPHFILMNASNCFEQAARSFVGGARPAASACAKPEAEPLPRR